MQPPASTVTQAAQDRLRQSAHAALREVTCEFLEGVLVLRGRVPSFYCKQLAQETIGPLEGVVQIVNEIDVVGEKHVEE
jgi:osmotically-inducible protein OsmY